MFRKKWLSHVKIGVLFKGNCFGLEIFKNEARKLLSTKMLINNRSLSIHCLQTVVFALFTTWIQTTVQMASAIPGDQRPCNSALWARGHRVNIWKQFCSPPNKQTKGLFIYLPVIFIHLQETLVANVHVQTNAFRQTTKGLVSTVHFKH